MPIVILTFFIGLIAAPACAQDLGRYRVDPDKITVSGISAGGYMAVQLGVAYSSVFSGVGVFAAGPYGCANAGGSAQVNVRRALGPCMAGRYDRTQRWLCAWGFSSCPGVDGPDAEGSIRFARQKQDQQHIDPLANLNRQRVFLLSGNEDKTVDPKVVDALARFYEGIAPSAQLKRVRRAGVAHTFPTEDFKGGNACALGDSPFISDCDYDGAKEVLSHLYGTLTAPGSSTTTPIEFDQRPFFPAGTNPRMADTGYLHVPASCADASAARCGLHVALHGCRQTLEDIGRAFVESAGYNRWADANRLIVLYPQVKKTSGAFSENPRGCWDWWGYTGAGWEDKRGIQMRAIVAMVNRLKLPSP